MSLESITWVGDMNASNPPGTDPKNQGDDHLRGIKRGLRDSFAGFTGAILVTGVDGGAVNAYTLTPTTPLLSYTARMLVLFVPTITNTGASTLNISGLGALPLVSVNGAALAINDLQAGWPYLAEYDGTSMRLSSVTKNYIDNLAFNSALPAQPGGAVPYQLITRAGNATWGGSVMPTVQRTSNTMLALIDSGKYVNISSGTFAQTFDAAAILGNGWWCIVKNAGTGRITLDPNGSETIDSRTSFIMYPNEVRAIVCDGSNLVSFVLSPFYVAITADEVITNPPGYAAIGGEAWSGGASGKRTNNTSTNSPGGAGAGAFPFVFPSSQLGTTFPIVIGQGGAAVTTVADGNPGGNTVVANILTVLGATFSVGGGVSQGATGGDSGFAGVQSGSGIWGGSGAISNASTNGPSSVYGSGCGGSVDSAGNVRLPGGSTFGGFGGAASISGNGTDGVTPGGGGGATQTGARSGAGARGEVRLRGIC